MTSKHFNLPPDLDLIPKSFEEDIGTVSNLVDTDLGESVLSMIAVGNFSLQLPCHFLDPIVRRHTMRNVVEWSNL